MPRNRLDQQAIKRQNRRLILECLRRGGPLSRADLAREVGLTKSTVSSLIQEMISEGLLQEGSLQSLAIGRPGTLIELRSAGALAMGIELGVESTVVMVLDLNHQSQGLWEWPEERHTSLSTRLRNLSELVHRQLPDFANVLGAAMTVPGVVRNDQTLVYAPGTGWRNQRPATDLAQQLGFPVWLQNDANASALGETFWGEAQSPLAYVMLGTGLGTGLVVDGQVYLGRFGAAGEIGHWLTQGPSSSRGPDLEEQVSLRAFMQLYHELDGKASNFWQVLLEAERKAPIALTALETLGDRLGHFIAKLAVTFDPAVVVLGGAGAEAWKWLELPLRKRLASLAFIPEHASLTVRPSAFGHLAPAMGAAAMVLQRFLATGGVWDGSPPISPPIPRQTIGEVLGVLEE